MLGIPAVLWKLRSQCFAEAYLPQLSDTSWNIEDSFPESVQVGDTTPGALIAFVGATCQAAVCPSILQRKPVPGGLIPRSASQNGHLLLSSPFWLFQGIFTGYFSWVFTKIIFQIEFSILFIFMCLMSRCCYVYFLLYLQYFLNSHLLQLLTTRSTA